MKTHIVTGYYGSGKTEFCVNYALKLRNMPDVPEKVYIADMDIINPYFRSREKAAYLGGLGIEIVGNALNNNTGQDIPAVSYGFLSLISRGECVIIDLAGSKAGLKALALCYDRIADYELLCVLNLFRPETDSVEKMLRFVRGINEAGRLPVTGIINNGHMLRETEPEHVLASQEAVAEVCESLGVPLRYTLIKRSVYERIENKIVSDDVVVFDGMMMREVWQ